LDRVGGWFERLLCGDFEGDIAGREDPGRLLRGSHPVVIRGCRRDQEGRQGLRAPCRLVDPGHVGLDGVAPPPLFRFLDLLHGAHPAFVKLWRLRDGRARRRGDHSRSLRSRGLAHQEDGEQNPLRTHDCQYRPRRRGVRIRSVNSSGRCGNMNESNAWTNRSNTGPNPSTGGLNRSGGGLSRAGDGFSRSTDGAGRSTGKLARSIAGDSWPTRGSRRSIGGLNRSARGVSRSMGGPSRAAVRPFRSTDGLSRSTSG
jgi:hypothetical protein